MKAGLIFEVGFVIFRYISPPNLNYAKKAI